MKFPGILRVEAGSYFTKYDPGFLSVSGYLELSKTFGSVTLTLRGERADLATTIGDVQRKVVENRLGFAIYAEPLEWLPVHASVYYGRLSDANNHVYAEGTIGVKV